jgi:hypothetical protein
VQAEPQNVDRRLKQPALDDASQQRAKRGVGSNEVPVPIDRERRERKQRGIEVSHLANAIGVVSWTREGLDGLNSRDHLVTWPPEKKARDSTRRIRKLKPWPLILGHNFRNLHNPITLRILPSPKKLLTNLSCSVSLALRPCSGVRSAIYAGGNARAGASSPVDMGPKRGLYLRGEQRAGPFSAPVLRTK